MKYFITFALTLSLPAAIQAQDSIPVAEPETQPFVQSAEELEELVGPIALYPDALIALILPASTTPSEIVLAARFLERNDDPETIDQQSWTDSVRGVARYPDVVKQMNEDLEWTIRLGDAFMNQPADVMEAIQRLRERAKANGSLVTTPEQTVVTEEDQILIVPTNPEVIYVPTYDTRVVYVDYPVYYTRPLVTFGFGFHVGSWLTYDCDWYGGSIWYVSNRNYWHYHRDWRYPRFPRHSGYVYNSWRRPWTPSPHYKRPNYPRHYDNKNHGGHPGYSSPPHQRPPSQSPSDPRWADNRNRYNQRGNRREPGDNNVAIRPDHTPRERTPVARALPVPNPHPNTPSTPNPRSRSTPPRIERTPAPTVSPPSRVVRTEPSRENPRANPQQRSHVRVAPAPTVSSPPSVVRTQPSRENPRANPQQRSHVRVAPEPIPTSRLRVQAPPAPTRSPSARAVRSETPRVNPRPAAAAPRQIAPPPARPRQEASARAERSSSSNSRQQSGGSSGSGSGRRMRGETRG